MAVPGIWATVEADAWARQFDYENYLTRHTLSGCRGGPLTEEAYNGLKKVLDKEMARDFDTTEREE